MRDIWVFGDFSQLSKRQELLNQALAIKSGIWTVTFRREYGKRSEFQNAWYWGGIVAPFTAMQQGQAQPNEHGRLWTNQDTDAFLAMTLDGERLDRPWTKDECHYYLRHYNLPLERRVVVSRLTGTVREYEVPGSTARTDTQEFADYCERCRVHLQQEFGVLTSDPDPEKRSERNLRKRGLIK